MYLSFDPAIHLGKIYPIDLDIFAKVGNTNAKGH